MDKLKIIYIGPMGYSGSTLLDLILNQHDEIQSVGEVISYDEWISKNLLCSCTNPIRECFFWNEVRKHLPDNFKFEGQSNKLEIYSSLLVNNAEQYASRTYKLFDAVRKHSQTKYILDSSKDVGRLEKLAGSSQLEIKVIHLVRNGKEVVKSGFKEKSCPSYNGNRKTKSRSAFKTSIRWAVVNRRIEQISENYNLDKILLKYEDLVHKPQKELGRVWSFLNLSQIKIRREIDNSNIHNISGSRWRYNDNLRIKKKDSIPNPLSLKDNMIFRLFAGRKYRQYGYIE